MASLVVDSSVVIKWFDAEPYAAEAERILVAYEQETLTLLAPDLLFAEVGKII
jgi:predicted nucleic acid-binding protein